MRLKAGCCLAATVLALTACGGSESGGAGDAARKGSPPPEKRLSKAEARYVERLDVACRETEEVADQVKVDVNRLERRLLPRAQTSKKVVKILDKSGRDLTKIRKRIRRLKAPPGERRFHRRYLAYSDRVDALNLRDRNAIARGASRRGGELAPNQRKLTLARKRLAALVADHGGFRHCG